MRSPRSLLVVVVVFVVACGSQPVPTPVSTPLELPTIGPSASPGATPVTAIGSPVPPATASPSPTATSTPTSRPRPTLDPAVTWGAGDGVVLRLSEQPTYWWTRPPNIELPMVSLYGNGRLIWHSEGRSIISGAPPPTVLQAQLTPAGMRTMLEMVDATGLLDAGSVDLRYPCGGLSVTDASIIGLHTVTSLGEVQVSTYALEQHTWPDCEPSEQHAPYVAMEAFVGAIAKLPAGLAADEIGPIAPYVPPTLILDVEPWEARPGVQVREWPLGDLPRPRARGERLVVAQKGSDVDAALTALREGGEGVLWTSGGRTYLVSADIPLPDE